MACEASGYARILIAERADPTAAKSRSTRIPAIKPDESSTGLVEVSRKSSSEVGSQTLAYPSTQVQKGSIVKSASDTNPCLWDSLANDLSKTRAEVRRIPTSCRKRPGIAKYDADDHSTMLAVVVVRRVVVLMVGSGDGRGVLGGRGGADGEDHHDDGWGSHTRCSGAFGRRTLSCVCNT